MLSFEKLFGFEECSYKVGKDALLSLCTFSTRNGREGCSFSLPQYGNIHSGFLYTPSVRELRAEVKEAVHAFDVAHPGMRIQLAERLAQSKPAGKRVGSCVYYSHVVGDTSKMHPQYPGALFQAASQFNLLEFIHANVTPEEGIANYVFDYTQGPAAAVACYGGTAYRNYLIHPSLLRGGTVAAESADASQRGQTADKQADMLADVTSFITSSFGPTGKGGGLPSVPRDAYYYIRNGYFRVAAQENMMNLGARLEAIAKCQGSTIKDVLAHMSSLLRIGVVEDVTVTSALPGAAHMVTQTYNSALSLSGRPLGPDDPTRLLATSVLNGTYEATLLAGVLHTLRHWEKHSAELLVTGNATAASAVPLVPPIFLTKVGGGVFCNKSQWIKDALTSSLETVSKYDVPLDVQLVHFRMLEEMYLNDS